MQGYKFINIKIQTALIKQMAYSYLFDIFFSSPNIFVTPLINLFYKDINSENSRQDFLNYLNQDNRLFNGFLEELNSTKYGSKPLKYIYLTCLLNKDMSANFENLSDSEIETIGLKNLRDIFFYAFFDCLKKINDEYKFVYDPASSFTLNKDFAGSLGNSINGLINNALYIETLLKNGYPIFNSISDYKKVTNSLLQSPKSNDISYIGVDSTTKLDYGLVAPHRSATIGSKGSEYNYTQAVLSKDVNNFLYFNNLQGIVGSFYYKIKDVIPVELDCGADARKNPIIISRYQSGPLTEKAIEVFCVQQYYDWKINDSYRSLEQFIFYRQPSTTKILNSGIGINGNIQQKPFDVENFYGMKFLKRDEILNLQKDLLKSGKQEGFIAFIPVRKVDDNFINKFNNNGKFNNDPGRIEKITIPKSSKKMSYMEVSDLLSLQLPDPVQNNWRLLTPTIKLNATAEEILSSSSNMKNFKTFSSINSIESSQPNLVQTNFDINDLFDLYFNISIHSYEIRDSQKIYKKGNYYQDIDYITTSDNENLLSNKDTILNEKKGKFLLLTPVLASFFDDDLNTYSDEKIQKDEIKKSKIQCKPILDEEGNQKFDVATGKPAEDCNIVYDVNGNVITETTKQGWQQTIKLGLDFKTGKRILGDNKKVLNDFNAVKTKYILLNKYPIIDIKINDIREKVFSTTTILRSDRLFYPYGEPQAQNNPKDRKDIYENLEFIKQSFSYKLAELLKDKKFDEIINTFYSSNLSEIDYSKLDLGQLSMNKLMKPYQNFQLFLNYYIDAVENLAEEAQDRV